MDALLSEKNREYRARANEVAEVAIRPVAAKYDREQAYPWEVLDALRDAVAEGSIRDDIEPEILIVPVMGTIHALAGMSGVHRLAARDGAKRTNDVLAGLEHMLAPPRSRPSTRSTRRK